MKTLIESLPLLGITYMFFFMPTAFAVAAYRKFKSDGDHFGKLDFVLLVLPWLAWISSSLAYSQGKSLSNAVIEPSVLGLVTSLILLLRLIPGYPKSRAGFAITLAGPVIAAVCIWFFVPGLPE
jgi:hypothetical protein